MDKLKNKLIPILLFFAIAITLCGSSAAATTTHTNNTNLTNSTVHAGDPIINGTVYIDDYGTRTLANATITVNSTTGKTLATTTTNQNGYYSVDFYSTNTSFYVTATYPGCTGLTQTVTVSNSTNTPGDPNYYGTGNFTLNALTATLAATANGESVDIPYDSRYNFAGAINVTVNGVSYTAYCIDLFTDISIGDSLWVNGPLPGTQGNLSSQVDWSKVTYIINNYSPSTDTEAAAIQCAIWYFTSAPYGVYNGSTTAKYQYMTYSQDGLMTGDNATVRNLALQIINATQDMFYPSSIVLNPGLTNAPNGQPENITATVYDQNGNPLPGIIVNFGMSSGSLNITQGVTNANGQVNLTLTPPGNNTSVSVTGYVSGSYGNLLYDNPAQPLQNLVAMDILPNIVSGTSIINYGNTANVGLSQTVNGGSNATVNVGDPLTYIITATNTGANNATGLMITDIIPSGLTNVTVTPSIGTFYNNVWTIPNLSGLASATLTIVAKAGAAMAGVTTNNTATRTYQNEYNTLLNATTVSVYTKKAQLDITNTANQSTLNVGNTGIFTLTVTNNGPDSASNIQINDPTPSGFTAGTPTIGTYINGIWTINSLASGSSGTLTFTGIITASQAGTNITNTATETQTEYPPATIPNATIYVKKANVVLTSTSTTPVNVGGTVTYTVTAHNNGPDTATNITINDIIPTGLTGVTVTPSSGSTYNSTTGVWTIPSLAYNTNDTLTITGTASAAMAGLNTTNTATQTNQTEYSSQYTTTNAIVYTKEANVKITLSSSAPSVHINNTINYTLTATNNGPDTADNIVITVTLPSMLTGIGTIASTGTVSHSGNVYTWTITSLASGVIATLNMTNCKVPNNNAYNNTNITSTATETQTEYNPNIPNTASCVVFVGYYANTNITNVANQNNLNVGQTGTFTVTVTNKGPDPDTNVIVNDPLPSGFTSGTPSIGTYNSSTGVWTITSLSSGSSGTLTFTGVLTAAQAGTNITNAATETQTFNPYKVNITNATIHVNKAVLTITNTANNSTLNVGNNATFTLNVTNNGPDTATNIIITDLLPAGFTIGTPSIGTYNTTTGVWSITSLASGSSCNLILTGIIQAAQAGTNITNMANETQSQYPFNSTIVNATIYVKKADVVLTQTSTTPVNVGGTVTYTVTVNNNGPDSASNVTISDTVPSALSGVTVTPSVGTYSGGVWTISNLAKGATATLTITGTATSSMAGLNTTNTATQTGQTEYSDQYTTTTAQVYTKKAVLTITNTGSPSTVNVGQTVTFTLNVTNTGPDSASNININDYIPTGLSGVTVTPSTGSYNGGVWTISSFAKGATATLTITGTVTNAQAGNNITNVANETQNEYPPVTIANANVYVKKADVVLTQTSTTPVNVGGTVTYTVTVTNNGPDSASNVTVSDTVPGALSGVTVTPSFGSYAGGVWIISGLAKGATATLTITGTATSSMAGLNTTNTATQTGQTEYSDQYTTTTAQVYTKKAVLTITNTGSPSTVNVGQTVTFTLNVTNTGPDSASNININDYIPTGLSGVTVTPSTGSYNGGVWTISSFAKGATATLTITGTVTNAQAGNNITNVANETQNEYPPVSIVNANVYVKKADVVLTQTSTSPVNVGGIVTYTVTVTNNGPDSASNVTISDTVPSALSGVTVTPSFGSYAGGVWTISGLAKGATATLTITGTATPSMAGLNTPNTATQTGQTEYSDLYTITTAQVYTNKAGLNIENTANTTTANVGDIVNFTLNLTNTGPNSVSNVNITDLVPAGLTLTGYTSSIPGSYNISTGLWNVGYLNNGATAWLTITGIVNNAQAGNNITNIANETQTEYPFNTIIPNATVYVKKADVVLTQTTTTPVNVGGIVTYTVTATNNGPDTASNVTINDTMPSALSGVTVTPSVGTYSGGVWTISSLARGATATLTITGTATSSMAGLNTTNTATQTGQTEYTDLYTTTSAQVYTKEAVLSITNTANESNLNVGQQGTFTLNVTNTGPDPATNIQIDDPAPNGFTAGTPSVGTYSNGIWTINNLGTGVNATLTFTEILTASQAGSNIINEATETQTEYPSANIPEAMIHVNKAVVIITNTPSNSTPNVGQQFYYTINLTNNGGDSATGVNVTELIPAGLTLNSWTASTGIYSNGLWNVGTLLNGANAWLKLYVTPTNTFAGQNIVNDAFETQNEYPNDVNASSTIHIPDPLVVVTNTGNPTIVNVGDTVNFTLNMTNYGPDSANGIQVTDQIPTGFNYNSYNSSIGSYDPSTGIWTVGTLNVGDSAYLTISGTATNVMAGGDITNTATEINDEYPFTVNIPNGTIYVKKADIVLTQTSTTPVNVGDTVTYTVTATNNGPDTATNINISDVAPNGLSGMTITPSIGTYNDGVWTIPSLADDASATLTITGTATSSMAGLNTINTATQTNQTEYSDLYTITTAQVYTKEAALTITNTGNTLTANVGDIVTFTLYVANTGPDSVSNVNITDLMPTGLTYNGYTSSIPNSFNYNSGLWNVGTLTTGGTAWLTITGTVTNMDAGSNIINIANETQTEYPSATIPKANIYVNKADVILTQTSSTPVNVGDTVTYTITATNNGPDTATNININDVAPNGLNGMTITPSIGTYNGGVWTISSLASGSSATLTITGTATSTIAGTNTINTATQTSQTEYTDQYTTTNANVYTNEANVTLSQVGGYSGNTVSFNVTAVNNGPDNASNITITDPIPSGLTNPLVTVNMGSYTILKNVITWTIPSLTTGSNASLTLVGTAASQTITTNNATITNQTEYNPFILFNSTKSVYTPLVDVSVYQYPWYIDTLNDDYLDLYYCDNTPVFIVDVYNSNTSKYDDATNVTVQYTMGNGFVYDGCDIQGVGTVNYSNNVLTWTIPYLPRGGEVYMKVFTRNILSGNFTTNLTNTATITHVDQSNVSPTLTAVYNITTPTSVDVGVNQTQNTYSSNGSKYVTYTITVINNGPDNATGVQVTDKLPTGLTYSSDTSGGAYNASTGVWNIGNLNYGQTETITITAKITGTGTIRNYVKVSSENQSDDNTDDKSQTSSLTVSGTYTSTTDVSVYQYPWYIDTLNDDYLDLYYCDNTPVFIVDVYNSNTSKYDDATNVTVQYTMGNGFVYDGCDIQGVGTVNYSNNVLTWTIPYLPRGGEVYMKVFTRNILSGNFTTNLTNTATITHVDQSNVSPTLTAVYNITTPTSVDVGVNQTQNTYSSNGSKYVTYTITVINNGPDNATGVQVTDKLPTGLTYSSDTSGGAYNASTGVWNIGNLNYGQTETITITAKITGTGTIRNYVKVSSENQSDDNTDDKSQTLVLV